MTTAELHEILDDENRKLTADELKEVVCQLLLDTLDEWNKNIGNENLYISQFYSGKTEAFRICLDLLEHLKGDHDERSN